MGPGDARRHHVELTALGAVRCVVKTSGGGHHSVVAVPPATAAALTGVEIRHQVGQVVGRIQGPQLMAHAGAVGREDQLSAHVDQAPGIRAGGSGVDVDRHRLAGGGVDAPELAAHRRAGVDAVGGTSGGEVEVVPHQREGLGHGLTRAEGQKLEGAIGAYAPELPAVAVVVGTEIEGAVEIGEAAEIAARFRSIAAGADLQLLHAAGCGIQPVELPTAGIGVGGEKELASAAHHRLGIGAVGGLVDVGHPAGAPGGAVAHPQLLVGTAVAGGEIELAAAGGEVGDAGTAAAGPDVPQQLGGGVGGGVEAPELDARAGPIGQEEQAPVQRGERAGVARAATGVNVKRPDLAGLGVKPHQLAADAVAAGIGGVGVVVELAAKGGEPGRIHTHRARHPGEQGSGGGIDLEEAPT